MSDFLTTLLLRARGAVIGVQPLQGPRRSDTFEAPEEVIEEAEAAPLERAPERRSSTAPPAVPRGGDHAAAPSPSRGIRHEPTAPAEPAPARPAPVVTAPAVLVASAETVPAASRDGDPTLPDGPARRTDETPPPPPPKRTAVPTGPQPAASPRVLGHVVEPLVDPRPRPHQDRPPIEPEPEPGGDTPAPPMPERLPSPTRGPRRHLERAAASPPVDEAAAAPAPTIRVSIGRVEVRAPAPVATSAPAPALARPTMTLDDYLRRRDDARGR